VDLSPDDVLEIAARGEGRDIEFKRGLPGPAKIGRTLCAFANTRGGMLLVGITDRGEVWGVPQPKKIIAALRVVARERLEPSLKLELQAVETGGGPVVCCSVPLSPARPHRVRKDDDTRELVVRAGSSNRVATGATLKALQQPHATKSLSALEKQVLAWVAKDRTATVSRFAKAHNIGTQRAKRTFVTLERAGRLVAHGFGARRVYQTP
jgi:predicted HTH transcriptional regulator